MAFLLPLNSKRQFLLTINELLMNLVSNHFWAVFSRFLFKKHSIFERILNMLRKYFKINLKGFKKDFKKILKLFKMHLKMI